MTSAERGLIEEVMFWYGEAPDFLPISVQVKCIELRQRTMGAECLAREPNLGSGQANKQGLPPVRLRPASLPPTK
jgi:hypothetical protein